MIPLLNNLTPQIGGFTTIGAAKVLKVSFGYSQYAVQAWIDQRAVVSGKIVVLEIQLQGSLYSLGISGLVTLPVLTVGSTAEKFANSLFAYRIADDNYTIAVNTVGSLFSSAHVVTASKFGVINIYVNAAGSLLTLSAPIGDSQTAALAAATAEAAFVISDTINVPGGYIYIGRILIENNAGAWTANTDDLTAGSDLTTASFYDCPLDFVPVDTKVFTAEEITAGSVGWSIAYEYYPYMRLAISVLTGAGKVYASVIPIGK